VDVANRLGGEIIRLWVASVDFREDVAASEGLMQRVSENYRKLRNTLRFLLSNFADFDPAKDAVAWSEMQPLDQYILARTAELDVKIRKAYDDFEFHRAYQALNEFTNTELSALYLDVVKDRLYTFAPSSAARRSAQTAMWRVAEAMTRLIAPILSFTADEVWQHLPVVEGRASSVHLALFPDMADIVPGNISGLEADWKKLLTVRKRVLVELEEGRRRGDISNKACEVNLNLVVGESTAQLLERFGTATIEELFGIPGINVVPDISLDTLDEEAAANAPHSMPAAQPGIGSKCGRCWRVVPDVGSDQRWPTVCARCANALEAIGFPPMNEEAA